MVRMPQVPATRERQNASRVRPIGLMTPTPVMTTRGTSAFRSGLGLGLDQVRDAGDHLRNVLNLLGLFIINLDVELTLQIEENIQAVERVDAQFLEAAFGAHRLQWDAAGVGNDLENTVLDRIRHKRRKSAGGRTTTAGTKVRPNSQRFVIEMSFYLVSLGCPVSRAGTSAGSSSYAENVVLPQGRRIPQLTLENR